MHPRSESRRRRRNVWKLFTELMTDVSEVVAMLYQGAANGLETTAEIVVEKTQPVSGTIIKVSKTSYQITRKVIGGYTLPAGIISLKMISSVGDALFSAFHLVAVLGKAIGKDLKKSMFTFVILAIVGLNNALQAGLSRGPATAKLFKRFRKPIEPTPIQIEETEPLLQSEVESTVPAENVSINVEEAPTPPQTTLSTLLNILEKFLTNILSSSLLLSGIFAALNNFNGFPTTATFLSDLFNQLLKKISEFEIDLKEHQNEILAAATLVVIANFIVFLAYQFKQGRSNAAKVVHASIEALKDTIAFFIALIHLAKEDPVLAYQSMRQSIRSIDRNVIYTLLISTAGLIARGVISYYSTGKMLNFLRKWFPVTPATAGIIRMVSAGNAMIAVLLNGTVDLYQYLSNRNIPSTDSPSTRRKMLNSGLFVSAILEAAVMTFQAFSSIDEEGADKFHIPVENIFKDASTMEEALPWALVALLIAVSYGIPQLAFLWKGVTYGLDILLNKPTPMPDIHVPEDGPIRPATPFHENLATLVEQRKREKNVIAAGFGAAVSLDRSVETKKSEEEKIISQIMDETLEEHARITNGAMPAPLIIPQAEQTKRKLAKKLQELEAKRVSRAEKMKKYAGTLFTSQREDSATEMEVLSKDKGKEVVDRTKGKEKDSPVSDRPNKLSPAFT